MHHLLCFSKLPFKVSFYFNYPKTCVYYFLTFHFNIYQSVSSYRKQQISDQFDEFSYIYNKAKQIQKQKCNNSQINRTLLAPKKLFISPLSQYVF